MKTVRLGCERLFDDAARLIDGRRVGLITNHSGVDRTLVATADRLHAYPHSQLVALFGPEHGIRGAAQDGEKVGESTNNDSKAFSLYNETRQSSSSFEIEEVSHYDIGGYRYTTDLISDYYDVSTSLHRSNACLLYTSPSPRDS